MNIENKINEIMNSLEGIQQAEPAPFFYTRVLGRLQNNVTSNIWEKSVLILSRPAVIALGLCLVIALNVTSFLSTSNQVLEEASASNTSSINTDNEFLLASGSSFQYANLDDK